MLTVVVVERVTENGYGGDARNWKRLWWNVFQMIYNIFLEYSDIFMVNNNLY